MAAEKPPPEADSSARGSSRTVYDLLARTLDPLAVVMLSRERILETLEDAVQRGRVTRSDANDLASELLRRGRSQTEELLADVERALNTGRDRLESSGRRTRISESVTRLARTADRARRSVGGTAAFAIADYDALTARQVQSQLGDLTAPELRQVREYERRHANRKTVLDAIDRALG